LRWFSRRAAELSNPVAATLDRSLKSATARTRHVLRSSACCWHIGTSQQISKEEKGAVRNAIRWPSGFAPSVTLSATCSHRSDPPLALAAAWALAWTGQARLPDAPPEADVITSLYRLWREADSSELRRLAAWAFATQPLLPRDTFAPDIWGDCDAWLRETASEAHQVAPLVLAWYRRDPWSDSELAETLNKVEPPRRYFTVRELLATLGESGRRVLEKWEADEQKR
jgi:hypothetical protein